MRVVGLTGPYTLPPDIEQRATHVVHVVAGSGVVPNFSILKDALGRHPTVRHTVLDSNKTWEDIIFREALARLAAEYPDRVRLVHFLTRQKDLSGLPGDVRPGRIAREAGVGRLIVSHIGQFDLAAAIDELKQSYTGPLTIGADLQCTPVAR